MELNNAQGEVLLALRTPRTMTGLARHGLALAPDQVTAALMDLDRLRLVLRDGNRWLSLVLPAAGSLETGDVTRRARRRPSRRPRDEVVDPPLVLRNTTPGPWTRPGAPCIVRFLARQPGLALSPGGST